MTIRITGYDIVNVDLNNEETLTNFTGVVHLEMDQNPIDMPFIGSKLKDQIGFNRFHFKDADEVRNHHIEEKAEDILGVLSDHLLEVGVEAGEFPFQANI